MSHFMSFITEHWVMVSLFVVVMILIFIEEAKSKGFGMQVTPSEATRMMNSDEAVVIDVRTKAVFSGGHIVNAINIPESEFKAKVAELSQYKEQQVIIVCASGTKAGPLAMLLKKQGFEKISVIGGGISEWIKSGLPLIKGKK